MTFVVLVCGWVSLLVFFFGGWGREGGVLGVFLNDGFSSCSLHDQLVIQGIKTSATVLSDMCLRGTFWILCLQPL